MAQCAQNEEIWKKTHYLLPDSSKKHGKFTENSPHQGDFGEFASFCECYS